MATDKAKRVIRDAEFAKRFNNVLDDDPLVPPYNYGRLRWVKDELEKRFKLKIATETVRKWLAGEATPRADKMRLLAELLKVDVGWLSLGLSPDLSPSEKRDRAIASTGAANVVAGFIMMAGGSFAMPDEGEAYDLLGILAGKQLRLEVANAASVNSKLVFNVSTAFEKHKVIAVVQTSPSSVDMFVVPAEAILEVGERRGDRMEVECFYSKGTLRIGTKSLEKISDIRASIS